MSRIRATDEQVMVRCDCGCCEVEFSKEEFGEDADDTYYNIAILDSYYDNMNGIVGRLRRAIGILFGKRVPFNDALVTEEEFDMLLEELRKLSNG